MFQSITFLLRCFLKKRMKRMTYPRKIRKICWKIRCSCWKIFLRIRCNFWNWTRYYRTVNHCCNFLTNGSLSYSVLSRKNGLSWTLNLSSCRYCCCFGCCFRCYYTSLIGSWYYNWVYMWYLAYCSWVYSSFLRNWHSDRMKRSFHWNCYLNNCSCLEYYFLL